MSTIALLAAQDALVLAAVIVLIALAYARNPLFVPAVSATVLFGAHTVLSSIVAMHGLGPLGPDTVVLTWIMQERSAAATTAMSVVSAAGGTLGMVVVAVATCAVLLWQRRIRAAAVVVVALGGAGVLVVVVKNLVARPRPPQSWQLAAESSYSLPSGHALSSTVVLGIVAAVVVTRTTRTLIRWTTVALAAGAVAAIGVSRLYLGVHWPSDVLDGWLLGGAWLTVCVGALFRVEPSPGEVAAADPLIPLGSIPAHEDRPPARR
ncbi:phosphatase PAP2 family protein [Pseudonocardia benzenivorans]|uniref:Phosphoesterase PA-phosphatase related protein n=2 Tax=Pseudonocardia TaxID=1847 RepID=F4CJU7_PSEUX|nr:phosphatase PAP2 family protein [Pseudonocardia dioxanivorans]AEA26972.1 phosphoesterase PA-phosphatase related protein [Pseudonocardia dioxanivorans CB1190]GJF03777.1 hypothetical protein PSD17_27360 [Pseudonocardia sp. D17]